LVREILEDLETLLDRGSGLDARLRGDSDSGEACLIRRVGAHEAEVLRLSWNACRIRHIEVQSRRNLRQIEPLPPADAVEVVERLVPMIWSHLRAGGRLPPGIRRFAPFFSLS
jgi:hypothetical protein